MNPPDSAVTTGTTTAAPPPRAPRSVATSTLLDAALGYAGRGTPVFPCKPNKRPYTANGFYDAATDPAQIRAWWKRWPRAGIGCPTGEKSGFWVLDVDLPKPNKPQDGRKTLKKLEAEHGQLPETREARTGSGGRHIYFKWDPAALIRIDADKKFGPGLDIRGEGGYVLLPPSPHESGNAYEWITRDTLAAPAPSWVVEIALHGRGKPEPATRRAAPRKNRAGTSPYAAAALEGELEALRSAPEGTRNNTLFIAAAKLGSLVAGGELDAATVESELFAVALAGGQERGEIQKSIASGMETGAKEPRTAPEPSPRRRLSVVPGGRQEEAQESGDPDACPFPPYEIMEALSRQEAGDATLLIKLFKGRLAYDHAAGDWYLWTGHHWALDHLNEHVNAVNELVDIYLAEARRLGRRSEEAVRQ